MSQTNGTIRSSGDGPRAGRGACPFNPRRGSRRERDIFPDIRIYWLGSPRQDKARRCRLSSKMVVSTSKVVGIRTKNKSSHRNPSTRFGVSTTLEGIVHGNYSRSWFVNLERERTTWCGSGCNALTDESHLGRNAGGNPQQLFSEQITSCVGAGLRARAPNLVFSCPPKKKRERLVLVLCIYCKSMYIYIYISYTCTHIVGVAPRVQVSAGNFQRVADIFHLEPVARVLARELFGTVRECHIRCAASTLSLA